MYETKKENIVMVGINYVCKKYTHPYNRLGKGKREKKDR